MTLAYFVGPLRYVIFVRRDLIRGESVLVQFDPKRPEDCEPVENKRHGCNDGWRLKNPSVHSLSENTHYLRTVLRILQTDRLECNSLRRRNLLVQVPTTIGRAKLKQTAAG